MVGDSELLTRDAVRPLAIGARMVVATRVDDVKVGRLHESTVAIDGLQLVSGTQSWTPNAIFRAIELSTYVRSEPLVTSWLVRFEQLWAGGQPL